MNIKIASILILLLTLYACNQESKKLNLTLLSNQIPVDTALLFGPGIISTEASHESAIAFNQDMTELYLNRRKPNGRYKIYMMRFVNGSWSEAKLASFYSEKDTAFADYRIRLNPQGDQLYFNSDRPLTGQSTSTGMHQWVVKRNNGEWEKPMPLESLSTEGIIVDVTSSRNGNLYFSLNAEDGEPQDEKVYYATHKDGKYMSAESMGTEINEQGEWTCCPFIAPDESYIIYDSPRESGYGWVDLYISFNFNGSWTKSYNLGPTVNTEYGEGLATISPDERFIFFYRDIDGTGDIYWADFAQLKKEILEKISHE